MDASEALACFVKRNLSPAMARRVTALIASPKGRRKFLAMLDHAFEPGIRPGAAARPTYDALWASPCFVFHRTLGFGAEFFTVGDAYDRLSGDDSWLILLQNGSAGIYRPEERWDEERLIAAGPAARPGPPAF